MMKSTTQIAILAIGAALLMSLTTHSIAFQVPVVSRSKSAELLLPLEAKTGSSSLQDGDGDGTVSRRAMLSTLPTAGLAFLLTTTNPLPSNADDAVATAPMVEGGITASVGGAGGIIGGATQSARVAVWPGIEGLEPMYELKLSIDAVATGIQDVTSWPYIQRRLDKFFSGFIVNEKNFYFGVGLQYMNEIQYDKNELPNYVLLDKQTRYDALDSTMKYLENLKNTLAIAGSDPMVVENLAKSAQYSLASWFALVPQEDVKAVEELFQNVKKADINRDGRLSNEEIVFLSPQQQEIWKRRVDKFG